MKNEKPEDAKQRPALLRTRGNAMLAGVRSGTSYRVTITGATHESFSDELVVSGGKARSAEILVIVRSYLSLREFFDRSLLGEQSALLSVPPAESAVQVEVFAPK